ncbi:hypothetical protein E4U48_006491 [Claviceps purpurea]|nr:hypothetical protein E4U48_006491 [Claviceps purpurea]
MARNDYILTTRSQSVSLMSRVGVLADGDRRASRELEAGAFWQHVPRRCGRKNCAAVVLGSIAVHQVGKVGLEILYREAAEGALQYDKIDSLANLIVEHGVPCIIAAANDGDSGLFYINGGASGKVVMAVASFDNIEVPLISYHSSVSMPLYSTSLDYHVGDDACQPLPANTPGLKNYLVLVRCGTCSYDDKLRNLVAKGAQ